MDSGFPYAWSGLVLAGGRSSRMGSDKAALVWKGKTLLTHAIDSLSEVVGRGNVVVSGRGEGGVPDLIPDLGPLGGIAAVSAELSLNGWLLVTPVDMPFLNGRILVALKNMAELWAKVSCRAVHFKEREFPFAFQVTAESRRYLANLCSVNRSAEGRSIRAFLYGLNSVPVSLEPRWHDCFQNINSPEDWRKLERISHERSF